MAIFTQGFKKYACDRDTIAATVGAFTLTATLYRDDDATAPDKRQDGFWPSLDPENDGYIGAKSKRTLRRHMAKAKEAMRAWRNDEWFYCGIAVTVECEGVQLTGDYDHALWGVECNYPGGNNAYLLDVANECAAEALEAARAKLKALQDAA